MKPSDIIKKKYFEMRGTHGDDSDMMFTAIFEYLDEEYEKNLSQSEKDNLAFIEINKKYKKSHA